MFDRRQSVSAERATAVKTVSCFTRGFRGIAAGYRGFVSAAVEKRCQWRVDEEL
jgi:hypothetical protein